MSTEIKNHRLGAFVYGFMSGVGLILIIWGLASVVMLPSRNLIINIGLILFGVLIFATGSCREAYLRGSLSLQSTRKNISTAQSQHTTSSKKSPVQTRTTSQSIRQGQSDLKSMITEQIREHPIQTEMHETIAYEHERENQT